MKSWLPETPLGKVGFWVGVGGAILLGLKFAGRMPIPTPVLFAVIFVGGVLSIWALARGDRSRLQIFVLLPIVALALIWTIAELAFPH